MWKSTSLPTIQSRSVHTELKQTVERFAGSRKRAAKLHLSDIRKEWLDELFDFSKCLCSITTTSQIYKDKLQCKCSFGDKLAAAEIQFLLDQRL